MGGFFRRTIIGLCTIAVVFAAAAGCRSSREDESGSGESAPSVVTADIEAGIRNHIQKKTRAGDGYFKLSSGDEDLSLKLVRVHTEYLANLGPRRHFACVDMVDTSGDVWDVDFFLAGDPGSMSVTETTIHKLNGKPFYTWEQASDGTWHRVEVEDASPRLLGVVRGSDSFEFLYRATLPEITDDARMWAPLATSDAFQTVEVKNIEEPTRHRVLEDAEYGNKILFWELGPEDSGKRVEIRYKVTRREKSAYKADGDSAVKYLGPENLVPINNRFRTIAQAVTEGKSTDLTRARALYDYVSEEMRYAKYGEGWGRGDATFACNSQNGNCTDYHSYFNALTRAAQIPSRFAIGAAVPSSRDEGGVNGYHCWVEFYADGKWWPVDISEADKYSNLATYYFGHHPANRLEFSRGRDLKVEPGPAWGPINFLAYPVLEIGGEKAETEVWFSFERTSGIE